MMLDYELRSPSGGELRGVLAELGGMFTIEWARRSPDRLEVLSARRTNLPPFTRIDVAMPSWSGRQYVWRGWLVRKSFSREGETLLFEGARSILRLCAVQAIFFSRTTVGNAFANLINHAKSVLASSTRGINISDWDISQEGSVPVQQLDLRDIPSVADAIDALESAAPGFRAVFAHDRYNNFVAKMMQPPRDAILVEANLIYHEEDYSGITNRATVLMPHHKFANLVPNGDFSNPKLASSAQANLVANPSFENGSGGVPYNWTPPQPGFYYEWDWNYGYTGTRNFKFHDCAEYSATAWLISDKFNVQQNVDYGGGFAYGCDPLLAQECSGPSTVKLKVEVRGYDNANNLTETVLSQEIAGADKFHNVLHWHWVSLPAFRFTNASTTKAEIRFLTFHGTRLYLDEVQVYQVGEVVQDGWRIEKTGAATATVTWFAPEGEATCHYVDVQLTAGTSEYVQLIQDENSPFRFDAGRSLYLRVWYSSLQPSVLIEWRDKSNGVISTQSITTTSSSYNTEEGIAWSVLSADGITPPVNAVSGRVILRWQNTTGESMIRCVYVGYAAISIPPAYGFFKSQVYDSDVVSYPAEADAEFAGEASNSPNDFGRLPALLIRSDITDNDTAQEYAKWYFLRRAVRSRTLRVSGARIDDARMLMPHLYRWRVQLSPHADHPSWTESATGRFWTVERMVLNHDGSWEAELGEYEAPASELIRKMVLDQS
jgi:hypothetical protein